MEFFRSFLRALGLLEPAKVDFISELPPELSQLILRKLQPKSLLCAALVSPKWLNVCRADKILRQTARHHKQRVMRIMNERFLGEAVDEPRTIVQRDLIIPAQVRRIVPFVRTKTGVVRKIPRNPAQNVATVVSVTSRRSRCIRM